MSGSSEISMDKPCCAVSVVVPVYQAEDTIAACIESIQQQTFSDLELILVDDGSTDNSGTICDSYAVQDARIHVIHQSNKGRTAARAAGVLGSTAHWVSFVDADDKLLPDCLAVLYGQVSSEVDIVLGNGQSLPNEDRTLIPIDDFRHLAVRAEGTIGVPWGSLYKRSMLTPYLFDLPRHIIMGEDYLFWLRLVFQTEKPVRVVYQSVYDKGKEHTSNCFVWTADYCYELNELRKASIPHAMQQEYLADTVADRMANMYSVALWSPRKTWHNSPFFNELISDMRRLGMHLSLKNRLFFALPCRMLRRMYSEWSYWLFLLLVGVAMIGLNLFDVPTLSDDMVYHFSWTDDWSGELHPISSLTDLFHSQYMHYMTTNGRLVVHTLAQFFLVFVPPVVLQLINSLLFVLLLHLSVKWVNCVNHRLFAAVIICFLLFVVFQGFRTTMVWSLGAFNYLWVTTGVLAFFLWLFPSLCRMGEATSSSLRSKLRWVVGRGKLLFLIPLALLAGWSHEALSLPIAIALIATLILPKIISPSADNLSLSSVSLRCSYNNHPLSSVSLRCRLTILFFLVGTMFCLLSPGIWQRSTEGITIVNRLLIGAMNALYNVRVTWLLLLLLLIVWKRNSKLFKAHLQNNVYAYVVLIVSLTITLLCGTNLERVAFFTDFMAMLLFVQLLSQLLPLYRGMGRASIVGIEGGLCLLMLLIYIPVICARKANSDSWQMMEQQMKETGRELIAVRCPQKGQNSFMDYIREHYVNPTADFGYYNSYMGFDATDINMRCAAQLYHKPQLVFLPEDVLQRIASDPDAYRHYALDRNHVLYVWRMTEDKPVTKLTFLLNDEDPDTLLLHQRLLAYHGNSYELDDFRYEVVHINHQPYLVFTKPTTNIYRRIKDVKYE